MPEIRSNIDITPGINLLTQGFKERAMLDVKKETNALAVQKANLGMQKTVMEMAKMGLDMNEIDINIPVKALGDGTTLNYVGPRDYALRILGQNEDDPEYFKNPENVTKTIAWLSQRPGVKTLELKEEKKQPTTAIAKFIQDNPKATPEELIAFSQKLKGKGVKITTGPNGETIIEMGGQANENTIATTSALQKDLVGLETRLADLDTIKNAYKKEYLTYWGKGKRFALNEASKLGVSLGEEGKQYVAGARVFFEAVEQVFNAYRKEITGAQAAMKEISMLRDSILNKKLSPDELEASYNRYRDQIKRQIRLKRKFLNDGVLPKDVGVKIDEEFNNKNDVTKISSEIDSRGDELKASGLSDEEVVRQLRIEGYLD